jgi:hypothetical protein
LQDKTSKSVDMIRGHSTGERPRLEIRMAANRDLPKLGRSGTTVVMARESDS